MKSVYKRIIASFAVVICYFILINRTLVFQLPVFLVSIFLTGLFFVFKERFKSLKISPRIEITAYVIIITSIVLTILSNAGMFTQGPITYTDFPGQYLTSYYILNNNLPYFSNLYGWMHNDGAGYIVPAETPPLPFLVLITPTMIPNIDLWTAIRLMNSLIFLVSVLTVFFLGKKFFKSNKLGFLSAVFWLAFPHNMFMWGTFKFYLALIFSMLSLYFYLQKKGKYTSSLFLGLSILSQPNVAMFSLMTILVVSLKTRETKKFFTVFFISLLLSSMYITQFLTSLPISSSNLMFWIEETPELYDAYYQFFLQQFEKAPHIFIFGLLSLLFLKGDKAIRLITLSSISIVVLLLFLFFFPNPLVKPDRAGLFLYSILVFPAIGSIRWCFKTFSGRGIRYRIMSFLLVGILVYYMLFYSYWMHEAWAQPESAEFRMVNDWSVRGAQNLGFTNGIFSTSYNYDMNETSIFISQLDTRSRILFEHAVHPMVLGSFTHLLAPMQTKKMFVGGPNDCKCEGYICPCVINGYAFGKYINEYNFSEFGRRLDYFNVEYLFVWDESFKEFLDSNPDIEQVFTSPNNLIAGYRYMNHSNSYVISETEVTDVSFDMAIIRINVTNATLGQEVILKSRHHPNWHGYTIEGTKDISYLRHFEITREDEHHFIRFEIPKSGEYTIYLQYDMSIFELTARNVTVISFFILLMVIIGGFVDKRK